MTQLKKYYFTFGSNPNFPYQNGWICIKATNRNQAEFLFHAIYPNPVNKNIINCSFIYTEDEFKHTIIYETNDNLGHACHATYSVTDLLHTNKAVQKMITLSTAHLTPSTRKLFDTCIKYEQGVIFGIYVNNIKYSIVLYDKEHYGYFAYIIKGEEQDEINNIKDLTECTEYALRNDCSIICFDSQGAITDDLPDYTGKGE